MKNKEVKTNLEEFYKKVRAYRDLLLESRNAYMPEIEKNHEQIAQQKKDLIRDYAKLQSVIEKFGKKPKMNDGVWNVWFSPYDNAFTSDTLIRVGPSLDAVLEDLDFAIGKLEGIDDEEEVLIKPKEHKIKKSPVLKEGEDFLSKIDRAINLAEQKLLKGEELNNLISDLKSYKPPTESEEIPKRKLEKIQREPNTVWSDPKGYAIGGVALLSPWREVFLELTSPEKSSSQRYFRPGSREEILAYLRPLVSSAKSIRIYDNYLGDEVLKLLESSASDAEIQILGGGGQVDPRFISKLPAFATYFDKKIEAKKTSKVAHARFYIVDTLVYHVDPSLKGNGADQATVISPLEKTEAEKVINDFEQWWSLGEKI